MKSTLHRLRGRALPRTSSGLALAIALQAVAGCGFLGLDDNKSNNNAAAATPAPTPTPAPVPAPVAVDPTVVPASAGASADAFVSYLKSWAANQDETSEPLTPGSVTPPEDDVGAGASIGS